MEKMNCQSLGETRLKLSDGILKGVTQDVQFRHNEPLISSGSGGKTEIQVSRCQPRAELVSRPSK